MIFSYTQIANYLRCPRSYRHRYLDGWREKETRAAMIFGRCFEKALLNLRGVIRTTYTNLNGHSSQNLDAFAPAAEWEALSCASSNQGERESSQDDL